MSSSSIPDLLNNNLVIIVNHDTSEIIMRFNKCFLSALFLGICSFGEQTFCMDFHVMPKTTPMAPKEVDQVALYSFGEGELAFNKLEMTDEVIVDQVKAIWVFGSDEDINKASPKKNGVRISDVDVPGGAKRLNKRLKGYIGKPLSKEDVLAIKREIAVFCQDRLDPHVMVLIPEQDVKSGIVRFVVQKGD